MQELRSGHPVREAEGVIERELEAGAVSSPQAGRLCRNPGMHEECERKLKREAKERMPLFQMRKGVPLKFIGVTRTQMKEGLVVELWPLASKREVKEFKDAIHSSEIWRVVGQ